MADEGDDGGSQLMGAIIGGYLVCMVCCTASCVLGAGMLLWTGSECLSQPVEAELGSEGCSRAGAYAMVLFGALPPFAAVSAQVYLQADARGWLRPASVLPGARANRPLELHPYPSLLPCDCGRSHHASLNLTAAHDRSPGGHGARRLAKQGYGPDDDDSIHAPLTEAPRSFEAEARPPEPAAAVRGEVV